MDFFKKIKQPLSIQMTENIKIIKKTKPNYENLVFEGGSIKAIAYIDAIKVLENKKILQSIKRFAGTSSGSIIATLCALGISHSQIKHLIYNNDIISILNPNKYLLTKIWNIWRKKGIHSSNLLITALEKVFDELNINKEMTFLHLNNVQRKELYIIGGNVTKQVPVIFNHISHPNMKIIDAVAISCCIPIYFRPFVYEGDEYIDGGASENFPIWIFNNIDLLHQNRLSEIQRRDINPKTLGLKLLAPDEEHSYKLYNGQYDTSSISSFVMGFIGLLIKQIERSDISPSYINNTIAIKTNDVSITDFNMDIKTKNELMRIGEEYTNKFFKE